MKADIEPTAHHAHIEAERHDCRGMECFCKDSPKCKRRTYGHLWGDDGRCTTCGIAEP